MFHARKRTKKIAAKPGRPKKAKKDQADEGSSVQCSPRTRLAAAREAADRAAKAAQLAADKATLLQQQQLKQQQPKKHPWRLYTKHLEAPTHLQGTISFFTVHFAKY